MPIRRRELQQCMDAVMLAEDMVLSSIADAISFQRKVVIVLNPEPMSRRRARNGEATSYEVRYRVKRGGKKARETKVYFIFFPVAKSTKPTLERVPWGMRLKVGHELAHVLLRHKYASRKTPDSARERKAADFVGALWLYCRGPIKKHGRYRPGRGATRDAILEAGRTTAAANEILKALDGFTV